MKHFILVLFVFTFGIFLSGCKSSQVNYKNIENKVWTLIQVEKNNVTESNPSLTFDFVNQRISGFAGCNQMSASLEMVKEPNSIRISLPVATRKACLNMNTEKLLLEKIVLVHFFELNETGRTLQLLDSTGNLLFLFQEGSSAQ